MERGMIRAFLRDECGATAIEYALIGALIFLAIIAAIIPIGQTLAAIFGQVSGALAG
jgi:pilus assembly protein Flp/PilA